MWKYNNNNDNNGNGLYIVLLTTAPDTACTKLSYDKTSDNLKSPELILPYICGIVYFGI